MENCLDFWFLAPSSILQTHRKKWFTFHGIDFISIEDNFEHIAGKTTEYHSSFDR